MMGFVSLNPILRCFRPRPPGIYGAKTATLQTRSRIGPSATDATMKRGILFPAFALLLGACSSTPTMWTKVGYSHQEFEADWAACKTQESPEQCMIEKGYTPGNQ